MTVITTSTTATATAYSNQRKIDRTSNGVLWMVYTVDPGNKYTIARYSTDNGATWIDAGQVDVPATVGSAYTPNPSFFIDQDDYAHLVFKGSSNGYIYYRRGTPNAGRTAWTWSAATAVEASAFFLSCDVVAHREGTGWVAHVALSSNDTTGSTAGVAVRPVNISSNGTITLGTRANLQTVTYTSAIDRFISIDFHHTGDGKTVAGGTPHLYVAWSAGATGSGKGIRFRKATYSAGAWTWGTEQEIDSTIYAGSTYSWLNCLFDGTRVVLVATAEQALYALKMYERDEADTTTVTRTLLASPDTSGGMFSGSFTYDASGNVYIFGRSSGTPTLRYYVWNRGSQTLSQPTTISTNIQGSNVWPTTKRGYSNNRIEFIYTDGTASPYSITYDSIAVNAPPSATITQPVDAIDPRVNNTVAWNYSDAEGTPQASFSAIVKTPAPEPESYLGGATAQTGTIEEFTVPLDGIYTIEAIGANGGDSSEGNSGGKGARVVGEFSLTAGEVLKVIAGKPGKKPTQSTRGGGGGGASWVYKTGAAQPMVAAGAGGGGGNYAYAPATQDASITTAGRNGTISGAVGGTNGNGGNANTYASGGAGWLTNGNSTSYTTGGATPANGAGGGNAYDTNNAWGGFGGGGGAYAGAGGGAGYSGGGAGGWSNSGHGGGGGSYNAGTNQIMEEGVGTGEGVVNIYMNSEIMFSTSGTTETSFVLPADTLNDGEEYVLELTVSDGSAESTITETVFTDSWNYEPEVVSSTESGNWDTTLINRGDTVEIQVATSDAVGFGPWSAAIEFINNNFPEVSLDGAGVFTETEGLVKWNYVDADGDVQATYQIRVRKKI